MASLEEARRKVQEKINTGTVGSNRLEDARKRLQKISEGIQTQRQLQEIGAEEDKIRNLSSRVQKQEAPAKGFLGIGLFKGAQQSFRDITRKKKDAEYLKEIENNAKLLSETLQKKKQFPEQAEKYDLITRSLLEQNRILEEASGGELKNKTKAQLFGQSLLTAAELIPFGAGMTTAGRMAIGSGGKTLLKSLFFEGAAFGVISGAGEVLEKQQKEPKDILGTMASNVILSAIANTVIGEAFNVIGSKMSLWLGGRKAHFTPKEKEILKKQVDLDDDIFESYGLPSPIKETEADIASKIIAKTDKDETIKPLIKDIVPEEEQEVVVRMLKTTDDPDEVFSVLNNYNPAKIVDDFSERLAKQTTPEQVATALKGKIDEKDIIVVSKQIASQKNPATITKILNEFDVTAEKITQETPEIKTPKIKTPEVKAVEPEVEQKAKDPLVEEAGKIPDSLVMLEKDLTQQIKKLGGERIAKDKSYADYDRVRSLIQRRDGLLDAIEELKSNNFKTKSDLTDIWNKANQSNADDALVKEAKKYKSAEEYVKAQGTLKLPSDRTGQTLKKDDIIKSFDESPLNKFIENKFGGFSFAKKRIYNQPDMAGNIYIENGNGIYSNAKEFVNKISLQYIEAGEKGTGLGKKYLNTLKEYSDKTGKPIYISDIANPKFFDSINWLDDFSTASKVYFPEEKIKLYRGVGSESGKSGFFTGKHFTTNKNRASEHGEVSEQTIIGRFFDLSDDKVSERMVRETGTPASGDRLSKRLKEKGYDGIKRGNEYIVFDTSKLKTKSQLTDISKQEQKELKTPKPTPKETPKETPKVGAKKDAETSKIRKIEGIVKERERGVAKSLREEAIKRGLPSFEVPKYKVAHIMKEQPEKATDFVDKSSPEDVLDVAFGKKEAPKGVYPEAVFIDVAKKAMDEGDYDLQLRLVNESSLIDEATEMGRRIKLWDLLNENSPIKIIRDIKKAHTKKPSRKEKMEIETLKSELDFKIEDARDILKTLLC